MTPQAVINGVAQLAGDTGHDRWSRTTWLRYLNQARHRLCEVRPDAFTEVRALKLAAGVKQTVPNDVARFLGLVDNQGSDGLTQGRTIRNVSLGLKDAFDPDWRQGQSADVVKECLFDVTTPEVYYVAPPVPSTPAVYVNARVVKRPQDVADDITVMDLDDEYEYALQCWMLHLAYFEDTEAGSDTEAQAYATRFYQALGIRTQVQETLPPRAKEDGN